MILVISFFSSIKGNCPAEWVDDKLKALKILNKNYFLVCGPYSGNENQRNKLRIPSISLNDWITEWIETKNCQKSRNYLMLIVLPVVLTFGLIFDIFLKKALKSVSGSKWSWCFLSFPITLCLSLFFRPKKILATGGPTAAHLTATLVGKILNIDVICELQDPIVSPSFNKNKFKSKIAEKLESFIISNSNKTVFVTKAASNSAKIRNLNHSEKITFIYPYSWNFAEQIKNQLEYKSELITIVHLGTLYGNRNIDCLLEVLEEINRINPKKKFLVVNMGSVYLSHKKTYMENKNFINLNEEFREKAIKFSLSCDILLLVQHKDTLSYETIPYKFYDYLNCNKPILALRENLEIDNFLDPKKDLAVKHENTKSIKKFLINFNKGLMLKKYKYCNKGNKKFLNSVKDLIQ